MTKTPFKQKSTRTDGQVDRWTDGQVLCTDFLTLLIKKPGKKRGKTHFLFDIFPRSVKI